MACFGTIVAMPAATSDVAPAPAASARQLASDGAAVVAIWIATYQLPTISAITIGVSAHSLPASTAHRAIGRDHRYVLVRSSSSSPIAAPTNIAGSSARSGLEDWNRWSGDARSWWARTIVAYTTCNAAISAPIHSALPRPSRLSVTAASVHTAD